jgi:hypothetical protein
MKNQGQGRVREEKVPRTITKAALYGNGSVKLKESSSGSTLGSPSITIAGTNAAESSNEMARERGAKNDWSEMRGLVRCRNRYVEERWRGLRRG